MMRANLDNNSNYWHYEHNSKAWTMDELLIIYYLIKSNEHDSKVLSKRAFELLFMLAIFKQSFSSNNHKNKEDILQKKIFTCFNYR
mgnify:CR=1 FL=1